MLRRASAGVALDISLTGRRSRPATRRSAGQAGRRRAHSPPAAAPPPAAGPGATISASLSVDLHAVAPAKAARLLTRIKALLEAPGGLLA